MIMGCCCSGYEPYTKLKPLLTVEDVVKQQQELAGKPVKLVGRAVPGSHTSHTSFPTQRSPHGCSARVLWCDCKVL